MKSIFLVAFFVARALAADASGVWTGTLTKPPSNNGEPSTVPAYLILKQEGASLTGTGGPDANEQHPIEKGKVEDSAVTFEIPAGDALMKFALKLDADSMRGELTREQGGEVQTSKVALTRTKPEASLFDKISALDAAVFAAYNSCDLKAFDSFLADGIEFYHDKGGLTNSRKGLVDSVQTNICGKTRRELVAGSLEVYPIPGYGAMEAGSHRFYNRTDGGPEKLGGIAKFLHIWRNIDGEWKLTRVVSYAHAPAPETLTLSK